MEDAGPEPTYDEKKIDTLGLTSPGNFIYFVIIVGAHELRPAHDILVLIAYNNTCVKQPLSKDQKLVVNTNYRLMQVKSIAECSKGRVLQTFDLH